MILFLFGLLLVGAVSFYVGWNLFSGEIQASVEKRLERQRQKASSILLKISRPLYRALTLATAKKIKAEKWKQKYKRLIISAGLEEEITSDELLAYKIFLGFIAPLSFYAYLFSTGTVLAWWLYPTLMLIGFMYPGIWVKGRRKRRHEEIKLQIPFVIDLLTLSTEAGLDFMGALQKVVDKTKPGPLVQEIERMLQEIRLGTTRADSLRNLAWRIDLTEVSSLVAVLVTADQMGSSIGPVLRVQADLIRIQRFTTAEKRGAAASQKLLFPLIFCVMPAVFIMIFGPVILGFLGVGK